VGEGQVKLTIEVVRRLPFMTGFVVLRRMAPISLRQIEESKLQHQYPHSGRRSHRRRKITSF